MPNCTFRIQDFADAASRRTDLSPTLATAGHSLQPAIDIATEVMNNIVRGGPDGQRNNWKWNRMNVVPNPVGVLSPIGPFCTFLTNAFQQDYAVPGVINVDWLEEAPYVNINQYAQPKQVLWSEIKRNLSLEYLPGASMAWKICFLPNYLMEYAMWGQNIAFQVDGMNSPGPGVEYVNPLQTGTSINNPCTQLRDPNGNYWALTTYGVCGSTIPSFPNPVTYPTLSNPAATASTVNDGTCVWTALNPNGMGFRLHCPPAGNSVTWAFRVIAQTIPQVYTSLGQSLGVIPDDMAHWFRIGFIAKCMEHSPDAKVRAKAMGPEGEIAMWLKAMRNAVQATNREQEDTQLVPMSGGIGAVPVPPNPAYPFPGGWGI